MPQMEKTLHGNADELNDRIVFGVLSNCPLTNKRGTWDVTVGDVRCIQTVFEKHAPKTFVGKPHEAPAYPSTYRDDFGGDDYKAQPHYSMVLTLLVRGEEIRLCAITSGSSQDMYFIPYSGGEYALFEALDITLNNLDNIYY